MANKGAVLFRLSPVRMGGLLLLGPLFLFFVYTIVAIVAGFGSDGPKMANTVASYLVMILAVCAALLFFVWLMWLYGVANASDAVDSGLPKKWFKVAFGLLLTFIVFNFIASGMELMATEGQFLVDARSFINPSREIVNFIGILMAYPLVCYYAARAIAQRQDNKLPPLVSTLLITFVLVFGTTLAIPFFHQYITTKPVDSRKVTVMYLTFFACLILVFIISFFLAIVGLV